ATQKALGQQLPLAVLHQAPTIEELVKLLDQRSSSRTWPCLVPLQPLGARPAFFCVHGAGGSVLGLKDLARHLAPDQLFYGIQAPPLQGAELRGSRVEDMAGQYVDAVRDCQPEGPYYLGGYSFGGSVALEMAQQLQARGETVALLVIL